MAEVETPESPEVVNVPDIPIATQNAFICYSRLTREGNTLVIPSEIPAISFPEIKSVSGVASAIGELDNENIKIKPKISSDTVKWEIVGKKQCASGLYSFDCVVKTKGSGTLLPASVKFHFVVRLRGADDVWNSSARFYFEEGAVVNEYISVLPSGHNVIVDYGASQEGELRDPNVGKSADFTDESGNKLTKWLGEASGLKVQLVRNERGTVTDVKFGGVADRLGLYFFWVYRNEWTEGGQFDPWGDSFPPGSNAVPVFIEIHPRAALPVGALAVKTKNGGVIPYAPPQTEWYTNVTFADTTRDCVVRDPAVWLGNYAYNVNNNSKLRMNGYGLFHYYPAVRHYVPLNGAGGGLKPNVAVSVSLKHFQKTETREKSLTGGYVTGYTEIHDEHSYSYGVDGAVGDIQVRNGAEVWMWEEDLSSAEFSFVDKYQRRQGATSTDNEDLLTEEILANGEADTIGFCRIFPASVLMENGKSGIFAVAHAKCQTAMPAIRKTTHQYNQGTGIVTDEHFEETTYSAGIDYQTKTLSHLFGAHIFAPEGFELSPQTDYYAGTFEFEKRGGYSIHDSPEAESLFFKAKWEGQLGNGKTTIFKKSGGSDVYNDPDMRIYNEYKEEAENTEYPQAGEVDGIVDEYYYEMYSEAYDSHSISLGSDEDD